MLPPQHVGAMALAAALDMRARDWSVRAPRGVSWAMEFVFERTRGAAKTSAEQNRAVCSRCMVLEMKEGVAAWFEFWIQMNVMTEKS
jgi:hypothetical protein